MANAAELTKLVTLIEENLRASPSAGLPFVDSRQHRERLISRQNHVVFGRRGAGKTSLVRAIRETDDCINIYLNLEDYKDITFPNIVIHVLVETLMQLSAVIRRHSGSLWHFRLTNKKLYKELQDMVQQLKNLVHEPDCETQEILVTERQHQKIGASARSAGLQASGLKESHANREVKREVPKQKMAYLRLQLTEYKRLIGSASQVLHGKPIFLVLDDFYFMPKDNQPDFIDYFHRLTKGTVLFLKVATIKHRSKLYRRRGDQSTGVESGHDVFEIDMDYSLDDFEELKTFMNKILMEAIHLSKAELVIDDLFAGDGFAEMCLASGGVPRDFLSLFVALANDVARRGQQIGKVQVREAAVRRIGNKLDSVKKDSGDEEAILINCLAQLKRHVYKTKKTNCFLVAKDDIDADPKGRQAIRELTDLRLIHLVDHNTSHAPTDGRVYEAYIIDVGLYETARPRGFKEISPGYRDEKARRDDLRASPVFPLAELFSDESSGISVTNTEDKTHYDQLQLSYE